MAKRGRTRIEFRGSQVKRTAKKAVELGAKLTLQDAVIAAKRRVSIGTTGDLERSIKLLRTYWRRGVFHALWGTTLEYGLYVEVGTGPHMPPVEPLKPWAKRHLGSEEAAWGLAFHIKKYGTQEHPYMRPTADEHYPKLADNIRRAWEKIDAGRSSGT